MINKNYLFTNVAILTFFLIVGYAPALFASDSIIVAQTNQQTHEKDLTKSGDGQHRHSQEKEHKHDGDHQSGHGKGNRHGGGHGHSMDYAHAIILHTDMLKLTNEQLGQIVRIHLKNKDVHGELKQRLKKDIQAFRQVGINPGSDDEQLRDLGKKHIDDFNAMIEHHIKERQAIRAILTDQQKALLKTIQADHNHGSHDSDKKKHRHGGY
ncbi:Spy/CpxP family protein refolding chaperone [Nitrosomonas sp.]|uniref:Spy/CpxP family protein refolding chaperone n=1 Tax=Nitrosomonas sp. TaxID=42353 RepID=UPI001D9D3A97|nr:Spy/CpxP family protein refolding chaperone [Nitrosomonas sp.]MBX3617430.1 Spy/CpxP family protein refolding chaperone [Nitrosomonas sp.]